MMFLDSVKLTFNNANLLWKVLLYHFIGAVLVCGLTLAVCYPLIVHLADAGFFADIYGILQSSVFNLQIDQILNVITQVIEKFANVISSDLGTYLPYAIIALAMVFVLGEFLAGLAEIPTKECLYGYMGSWSRFGFMGCFIKNLGKSVKFALTKLLVVLPYDLIMVAGLGALLYVFKLGTMWSLFVPFFMILALILFITIRIVLFGGWACSIVSQNKKVFQGLRAGVHAYLKAFGKVFSVGLVVVLLCVAANFLAIMLTASVGLVLTLPLSLLFMFTFTMVAYFYTNGLRFYIDKNNIVSPRKIEDFESMNVLKDII